MSLMLLVPIVGTIVLFVTATALLAYHMYRVSGQLQQLIDMTERVGKTAERAALRAETVLQYTTTTRTPPEGPPHDLPPGG